MFSEYTMAIIRLGFDRTRTVLVLYLYINSYTLGLKFGPVQDLAQWKTHGVG